MNALAPQQGNCIFSATEETGRVKQKTEKKNPYTGHQSLQRKAPSGQKESINKKGLPQKAFCGGINQLADSKEERLMKGLEKLTQLTYLNLSDNRNLPKAQIAELQKALPKCDILSNPTK